MRDYQTRAAVFTKWKGSPACAIASPGGLFETAKPEPRPVDTYTVVACKPDGKANQRSTGSGLNTDAEIDFRRLTLTVYGLSELIVATSMLAIDVVFADRQGTFPANALDFGADAHWMRTEPVAEAPDTIERAERLDSGQWWKGTLTYRVWTSRR